MSGILVPSPDGMHGLLQDSYLGQSTDPGLMGRTDSDGRNRELRTAADRWAQVPDDARRATDAEWASRGDRLNEAMGTAPSAAVVTADAGNSDAVAGWLYLLDVGVEVAGERYPVEDDADDARTIQGPVSNQTTSVPENECHGW